MIQTTIIPENVTFSVTVPKNYIGKKVYALFYIDEEITYTATMPATKKPSDFLGTLSLDEREKMHQHAIETRKEWNRDI
jgi:hypothetical protein